MRLAMVSAAALAALTAATASASAQRLTGPELQAAMIGHPLAIVSPQRGEVGSITWNADGTGGGEFRTPSGRSFAFTGKWEIRRDHFCRTLEGQGREHCFAIFRGTDGTLEQRDFYGHVALRLKPAAVAVVAPKPAPAPAPKAAPGTEPMPAPEEMEEEVPQK